MGNSQSCAVRPRSIQLLVNSDVGTVDYLRNVQLYSRQDLITRIHAMSKGEALAKGGV